MFNFKECRDASAFLRRLSHPTRLEILCCLTRGPTAVGNLAETLSLSQPTVSQFLSRMAREKIIKSDRRGRSVYYSINDKRVMFIMKDLRKIFCK